ncbi:hypothetical protein MAPG_09687 [Magnaporthiopsis poae ATCC 64411]|uniref:Uncharacterized protein n=1 Tax=Magnaporthiopsis poae (strain ATCC 64411 / 73-15) TaxID=644358 RepID=A0A0C4EAL2_MAGP6|nr:hypothetical protein MAPG_09687 [Magnaporthiopsis poae ATCC 64411]
MKGNPDIAGLGVISAFVVMCSLGVICSGLLLGYRLRRAWDRFQWRYLLFRPDGEQRPGDEERLTGEERTPEILSPFKCLACLFTGSHVLDELNGLNPRPEKAWAQILQHTLAALADTQFVMAFGVGIAAYTKCDISVYHAHISLLLMWLSMITATQTLGPIRIHERPLQHRVALAARLGTVMPARCTNWWYAQEYHNEADGIRGLEFDWGDLWQRTDVILHATLGLQSLEASVVFCPMLGRVLNPAKNEKTKGLVQGQFGKMSGYVFGIPGTPSPSWAWTADPSARFAFALFVWLPLLLIKLFLSPFVCWCWDLVYLIKQADIVFKSRKLAQPYFEKPGEEDEFGFGQIVALAMLLAIPLTVLDGWQATVTGERRPNGTAEASSTTSFQGIPPIRSSSPLSLGIKLWLSRLQAPLVGVGGIMGAQADVAGFEGRWKGITTDVDTMVSGLIRQVEGDYK